jgi:hypothetical protein
MFFDIAKVAPLINGVSQAVLEIHSTVIEAQYYRVLNCAYCHPNLKLCKRGTVIKELDPVEVNPYNILYLHFSMLFPDAWNARTILQISKGLLLINRRVAALIICHYYKYVIQFYCRVFKARKVRHLLKEALRHENKDELNWQQLLCATAS